MWLGSSQKISKNKLKQWKCDTSQDELNLKASIKSNDELVEDKRSILEAIKSMISELTARLIIDNCTVYVVGGSRIVVNFASEEGPAGFRDHGLVPREQGLHQWTSDTQQQSAAGEGQEAASRKKTLFHQLLER